MVLGLPISSHHGIGAPHQLPPWHWGSPSALTVAPGLPIYQDLPTGSTAMGLCSKVSHPSCCRRAMAGGGERWWRGCPVPLHLLGIEHSQGFSGIAGAGSLAPLGGGKEEKGFLQVITGSFLGLRYKGAVGHTWMILRIVPAHQEPGVTSYPHQCTPCSAGEDGVCCLMRTALPPWGHCQCDPLGLRAGTSQGLPSWRIAW